MKNNLKAAIVAGLVAVAACSGGGSNFYGQVSAPDGVVEAAEVVILDSSQNVVDRAITGSSGKFSLRSKLVPGVYVVEVKKQGYQTMNKTFSFPEVASLDVSLVPQMTVKGLVRLSDQSVASKAIVTFKRNGQDVKIKAIADEGGNYLVEGLDAGEYTIDVVTPDGLNAVQIDKFQLSGQKRVVEQELILQPAKRTIEEMEGDVQKSRVIQGVDAPVSN
jgi:Carboxypeptidase regulatory-like domain